MSDEKIDALDRRVTELLTITGRLVETVTNLAEQQNKFAEEQRRLAEEQRITSAKLDDALRVILEKHKKTKNSDKKLTKILPNFGKRTRSLTAKLNGQPQLRSMPIKELRH